MSLVHVEAERNIKGAAVADCAEEPPMLSYIGGSFLIWSNCGISLTGIQFIIYDPHNLSLLCYWLVMAVECGILECSLFANSILH